jgi:hypothetical protein
VVRHRKLKQLTITSVNIYLTSRQYIPEVSKLHTRRLENLKYHFLIYFISYGGRQEWREDRREKCTRFWWESPKERDNSEDRDIDGSMGSEWNLLEIREIGWGRSGFNWLRIGKVAGTCECGDEPSSSNTTELVS